jgi:hypothetical protein
MVPALIAERHGKLGKVLLGLLYSFSLGSTLRFQY